MNRARPHAAVVTLRAAGPADLPTLQHLDAVCFRPGWSAASWDAELAADDRVWLLATVAGEPAGLAGLWLAPDAAHVLRLGVDPAHRRSGLGDRLVAALVVAGADAGAAALTLEVRASNTAARNLYRRHGFVAAGTRPGYYPDGEDAVILWRDGAGPCAGDEQPADDVGDGR